MKLYDTNGILVTVDVRASSRPVKQVSRSKLQKLVGERLEELYRYSQVLEEFPIPGGDKMMLDFFIPSKKVVVEVSPIETHGQFTPHFHGNKATSDKFAKQVKRDFQKENWCQLNGFTLIVIESEAELDKLNNV